MELKLQVQKECFEAQDGKKTKQIYYYSYTVEVGGETFRLQPKPEDKRMLTFFLNDLIDNEEEV